MNTPSKAVEETEEASINDRRIAIFVLGMHRSGTSAVTRVINLLGADLPSNLMPAVAEANEPGFWESMDAYRLNDEILVSAGSRWDDWRRFNPDWFRCAAKDRFKSRALAILEQDFEDSPLFVLKDPRICRLLPFWLDVLRDFGAEFKGVLPIRNPLEVAASLEKRDGIRPARSHMLWLRHVLDAEYESRGLARDFVTYDRMLEDWRGAVIRLGAGLDISWPRRSATSEAEIDGFLEHRHRHHAAGDASVLHHPDIAVWVKETYAALLELEAGNASAEVLHRLDGIRAEFDRAGDALGAVVRAEEMANETLASEVAAREQRIAELEREVSDSKGRLSELEQVTAAQEVHASELEAAVGTHEAHARELEHAAGASATLVNRLQSVLVSARQRQNQLSHLRDQALFRLNAIQTSACWQLAAPFRAAEVRWPRFSRGVAYLPKAAWWTFRLRLPERLRLRREARALLAAGLFDLPWYIARNPQAVLQGINPIFHWLEVGWKKGEDPNPLFDSDWYLAQNPDVADAGMNPLVHYLASGAREGRDPNPLFDSDWYLAQNPDVSANPLVHYQSTGAAEGRDPHPLFDSDWYLDQNPEVAAAGVNPLADYLHGGFEAGRDPNPLFDSDWYLEQNPDVAKAGVNPLVHYLVRGAEEGRNPSPSFDTKSYLAQHADVAASGIHPLVHYVEAGRAEGRRLPTPPASKHPVESAKHAMVPAEYTVVAPAMIQVDERNLEATAAKLSFDTCDEPAVSVIIPAFNKVEYTLACLASVCESPPETSFEILVVDDGSTDRTPALVGSVPGIRHLRNTRNLGFLLSANRGARAAKGRFLMFLNNDTQVTPGWLDELVRVFDTVGDAGLVGSKLIYPSGHLQEAGVALKPDGSADLVGLNDSPDKPEYNLLREVDHCSGAAFLVEKALFDALGGFHEQYAPAYYEDCDLSMQVRASGRKVIYQPRSVVIHHMSVTTADMPVGKMTQIEKNKVTFLSRWRDALQELNSVRLLAFYLPQYHPISENDQWWGRGFTEWTNVVQARPQFEGHYQPHLPADLGFYDLRLAEVRESQAELARRYGIYGFCYYYYWFSGKRLLERPLDDVLRSGRPDFPFCICWANENWTRRWDGKDSEVLMEQRYSQEDDYAFIRDVLPILEDRRYVRVKGKPLLLVYRIGLLPQPSRTASIWRDECRKSGLGELYLAAVQSFGDTVDPRSYGFDAAVEFPPHGAEKAKTSPPAPLLNQDFRGVCFDYGALAADHLGREPVSYTRFKTVMPSWDNSARRKNAPNIFINCTPDGYEQWLRRTIAATRRFGGSDERFVFVNAWNEWAEGNHLEPDQRHGHAFLRATRRALDSALGYTGGASGQASAGVAQPPGPSFREWRGDDAGNQPETTLLGHPFLPTGRGEDIRSVYRALRAVGMPARVVDIYRIQSPDADLRDELAGCLGQNAGTGVNIYHINGDEVEQSLAHLEAGERLRQGAYNIVYPAWELSRYPSGWARQLDRFDEVWAPSKFVYESIADEVKAPVIHMPLPSEVQILRPLDRRHFGISDGRFVFLFFFDFTSFVERKNPFAAFAAFDLLLRRRPHANVEFVVKLSGSAQRPQELAEFHRRIEDYAGKVRVLDRILGENEMRNLVRCCDCFVSLHRSEGFGRGLAEAMCLGKPVIATGYSGNLDFTAPENALLVDYRLVPVRPGSYPHADGQVWAEPDVEQAAEHMVRLIDDPRLAQSIGESARSAIRQTNGYRSLGLRYQERIRSILQPEEAAHAPMA